MFAPVKFDGPLSVCMEYLDPRPEEVFIKLEGRPLSSALFDRYITRWMEWIFINDVGPLKNPWHTWKYHLGKGSNQDLLFYEWSSNRYTFRMFESSIAILLRVRPKAYADLRGGIEGQKLADIIEKVVNFSRAIAVLRRNPGFSGDLTPLQQPVLKMFRLPARLNPGDVFSNADRIGKKEFAVGDWSMNIVGFISYSDICLFFYKANGGRAGSYLPNQPDWVQRDLLGHGRVPEHPRGLRKGPKDDKTQKSR